MTASTIPTSAPYKRATYVALTWLIWFAILMLPVTGLSGISALGELKGSASVYIFMLAILLTAVAVPLHDIWVPRSLLLFLTCLLAWLAITTLANFEGIAVANFHGRGGLNKLVTSSAVVVFGMTVAVVCLDPLRQAEDLDRLFVKPLVVAVIACAVFAIPEIWSWFSPTGEIAYRWSTGLLHTADDNAGRVPGRLVSLAFEAPDLSYFCGFACPWLLYAYRLRRLEQPSVRGQLLALAPLLLGVILLFLSNSRTGLLMLAGTIMAECIYWIGLRRLNVVALSTAVVLSAFAAVVFLPWLALHNAGAAMDAGDVSTTSRLALFSAQLSIFERHPALGVGLGQFGFHARSVLPTWAWDSYEVVRWFETLGDLPPTFNMGGRLGAELGLPGLAIWYGFWIWATVRIARAARNLPAKSVSNYVNAAVLASVISFTLGGTGNDAFRRPETWVLVAITALYAGRPSSTRQ